MAAVDALFQIFQLIPQMETFWFVNRLLVVATSCDDRRNRELEPRSWWDFTDADHRGPYFKRFYATGMTRCSVACNAQEVSARSAGLLVLQLVFKLFAPGGEADRVLNGPTTEVWLDPWLNYLREKLGVAYLTGQTVTAFRCDTSQKLITGVDVVDSATGVMRTITADYYISAIPGDCMKDLLAPLRPADPALGNILKLQFEWMNGLQLFLKNDVKIAQGHVIYFDSPWALTSISQQQFWNKDIAQNYGDGNIQGIFSIDISNWNKDGQSVRKPAKFCTADEIIREVLYQLAQHWDRNGDPIDLDQGGNVGDRMLDPDIYFNSFTGLVNGNAEQLMVTVTNSLQFRPQAVTAIKNLFLASDYIQTSTDAITMEGANEAARRAVNGILAAAEDSSMPCRVWELREPDLFEGLRAADEILYRWGLPNAFAMPFAELKRDGGVRWFQENFRHPPPELVERFRPGIEMQGRLVAQIEQGRPHLERPEKP
jgi:uncharacterized protein with NAD-binding domain and iron-sulfur cluster